MGSFADGREGGKGGLGKQCRVQKLIIVNITNKRDVHLFAAVDQPLLHRRDPLLLLYSLLDS